MTEMNLPVKQTHRHREQTSACQRVGEGWNESLGLADANSHMQNG